MSSPQNKLIVLQAQARPQTSVNSWAIRRNIRSLANGHAVLESLRTALLQDLDLMIVRMKATEAALSELREFIADSPSCPLEEIDGLVDRIATAQSALLLLDQAPSGEGITPPECWWSCEMRMTGREVTGS